MSLLKIFGNGFPALALASTLVFAVVSMARAAEMPSAGQPAPGFTLNSQEGKPVNLKDFRGKWVVLYFYPKDMTQGCTIEAHNFQRDLAQYDKTNAVILGVSVDSVDSHQEFCTKESLTFKLLSDASHAVTDSYGSLNQMGGAAMAARNTFLIDPQGVIRKVYAKVNPNPHSEEVLAALAELKAKGE
jgi:peroxiredoxin Q/BCP